MFAGAWALVPMGTPTPKTSTFSQFNNHPNEMFDDELSKASTSPGYLFS
ncbi:hypothetical protein OK016_15370 [Vibrio chagasii]|nr:hypothetical protein [Vibrio chagasii]